MSHRAFAVIWCQRTKRTIQRYECAGCFLRTIKLQGINSIIFWLVYVQRDLSILQEGSRLYKIEFIAWKTRCFENSLVKCKFGAELKLNFQMGFF